MTENYRNLPLLLLKTREHFMGHFRPILTKHGLTEQQWRILQALHESGDMEPHQLCERCCILSPSMAGILKRMDDLGLIHKQPMHDQRRILISLTERAQELYGRVQKDVSQEYANIEAQLDTKALQNLYGVLDKLIEKV